MQNAETVTLTGDGATTAFVIPHGLRSTPVYADVKGLGAAANAAAPFKITSVDATNINVTATTAPASGAFTVMIQADDAV